MCPCVCVCVSPQVPLQPLSPSALNEAIVRIYTRALATVETTPVWGAMRSDTVYDAIMDHYAHQRAPGTFNNTFLEVRASWVHAVTRIHGSIHL